MNNSNNKAKRISVALLVAVLAVSTSFASVMTGCGNKDESSSTAATVASSTSATAGSVNTTSASEKSESEQSSQSSNSQNSGSQNSQTSEKSESEVNNDSSKSESKSESSKSNNSNNASDKTSSNSSNNSSSKSDSGNKSSDTLAVDGHDYKKGDTVTVTYSVKSTKVLANFQATISYDSSKLKVQKAELQSHATTNSIINAKNAGVIKFNGSDITKGYDYRNGGDLVVVTYEATGTGSASTSYLWESASTIEDNKIITHIDDNGKSDGTVTLSTSYK